MTEIRYINNAGGGFNGRRTVEDGTTIEQFFQQAMPGEDRAKFNIRVNNAVATPGYVLRGGDLVSVIPGKYDGGAFGTTFIANLQAAAQLGAIVRETPGLADQLKAVNDLGEAIKATPNLAENITAVVQFVQAVQVLGDEPAPDAATGRFTTTGLVEAQKLYAAVGGDAETLLSLLAKYGGFTGLRLKLAQGEQQGRNADAPPTAELIGRVVQPGEIDTTPTSPGCVRLVTGYGLGRDEPIEPGETIERFFRRIKPGMNPEAYLIGVNGSTVDPDLVLQEGFSVVIRDISKVGPRVALGASY